MISRGQPRADTKRAVWLGFSDYVVLEFLSGYLTEGTTEHGWVLSMIARKNAAPTDPVDAVIQAIDNGYTTDRDEATAVLSALGYESGDKPARKPRTDEQREDVLLQMEHLRGESRGAS